MGQDDIGGGCETRKTKKKHKNFVLKIILYPVVWLWKAVFIRAFSYFDQLTKTPTNFFRKMKKNKNSEVDLRADTSLVDSGTCTKGNKMANLTQGSTEKTKKEKKRVESLSADV